MKLDNNSYILIGLILFLVVVTFVICMKSKPVKSTFGESTTPVSNGKVTSDTVFIFYAPWCGHCKSSMNEFKDAVAQGQGDIILIDSTNESNASLVSKYNIKGFPTIIKGDGTKYTGSRTAESIVSFSKNEN